MNFVILIVFLLIIAIPLTLLQIFLAMRENKWLGLIIPSINFAFAILIAMNIAVPDEIGSKSVLFIALALFIPFIINFIIYFICKNILKKKSQTNTDIQKMKIKDL